LGELAESFRKPAGLLNPIIVRPEKDYFILVAGECRLRAWIINESMPAGAYPQFKKGIPCRLVSDLSPDELFDAEFEENYRRKSLSWQDEAVAFRDHYDRAQERYNEELIEARKEDIYTEWPEECPFTIAAGELNIPDRTYRRLVIVGRKVLDGDKEVLACDSSRAAGALLDRRMKRIAENELSTFGEIEEEIDLDIEPSDNDLDDIELELGQLSTPARRKFLISHESFSSFIDSSREVKDKRRYNFVHCDFPYGKGLHESDLYNTEAKDMSYEDTPDIYWALCYQLFRAKEEGLLSASCHIMFWFPMNFYTETVEFFSKNGFRVEPYPLIWIKSDKMGIIPDPTRGPRRIYETALIMSLGDRKIIKPTVNGHWAASGRRSDALHVSSKPTEMLRDFTRMFIDSDSVVLDPTCGSGTAIEVALLQHCKFAVGLDINMECVAHSEERAQAAQELLMRGA
jgi:hypothetical protein